MRDRMDARACRVAALLALAIVWLPSAAFAAPAGVGRDPARLLAASRRALGGEAVESVRTITAEASVRTPNASLETRIVSDRTGRARMEQGESFIAVVTRDGGAVIDPVTRTLAPLDPATRTVVRGHEVHMVALFPTTLWSAPRWLGRSDFEGQEALGVGFTDELGAPVSLYLSEKDALPLGYDVENHSGTGAARVRVVLQEWMPLDGVQLCREAIFVHGPDRYRYTYTQLRLNVARDSELTVPEWPATHATQAVDSGSLGSVAAQDPWLAAAPRGSLSHGDVSRADSPPASASAPLSAAQKRDVEVLLKLHRAVLDAHRRQDADAIVDREADDYVIVNRGVVSTPSSEERRARLAAYLGSTRFQEYRDMIDPIVRISEDGMQGWVVAQVFASGVQDDGDGGETPIEFTCAWVELYEKRAGRWVRVGNVSNFKETR
jgi:hypothetical protein